MTAETVKTEVNQVICASIDWPYIVVGMLSDGKTISTVIFDRSVSGAEKRTLGVLAMTGEELHPDSKLLVSPLDIEAARLISACYLARR